MRIAVVEGDGIGKEVIPVASEVLASCLPGTEFIPVDAGFSRWKRTGEAIGGEDMRELQAADSILFGAVTTPPDPCYLSVVVRIRKTLELYANIRPVSSATADLVIVRENTEGLYSGIEEVRKECATTLRLLTRRGCERIARAACAITRSRHSLTIGHKANVLKSDVFFREIAVQEAEKEGISWNEAYIDALALDILIRPRRYDVIVTTNLFGDILSDVAAFHTGGLGMLPSANIGDRHALFEPVHGSAPDIAGKGIANPVAAIRSVSLLLSHNGYPDLAAAVDQAVDETLAAGIKTPDLGGTAGTADVGSAVISRLRPLLSR